jgi:sugar transferase (PEP-CTERM/EpsH1 system associated)
MGAATGPCSATGPSRGSLAVLVLSPVPHDALRTGHGLRVHHMLRHLAARHRITLVHWNDDRDRSGGVREVTGARIVPCQGPSLTNVTGLRRLARAFPVRQPYPSSLPMREAIERLLATEAFDVVLAFHPALLGLAAEVRSVPVVADFVDEPVLGALRQLRAPRGVLGFTRLARFVASAIRYERANCRKVSCCVVVSDADARCLRRIVPDAVVHVVPNGVDPDYFKPLRSAIEPYSLVFTGRMDFPPNVDGALHFHRRILPKIRASCPQVRWTIVGAEPTARIRTLRADPGVMVTGYVEDVRPHLASAAVVVSPLVTGGGIKTKVLEAWAMSRAVVATSLGCTGLRARDGENIRIADRPADFAVRVLELLYDTGAAAELGRMGRITVLEHYGWDAQASCLERILYEAIEMHRRA